MTHASDRSSRSPDEEREGGPVGLDHGSGASEAELEMLRRALTLSQAREQTLEAEVATAVAAAEEARRASRHEQRRAEQMESVICQIHRSLFATNAYELILRACLTISHATRGVYITWNSDREVARVRAAFGVEGARSEPLSPFLEALCRRALESRETQIYHDASDFSGLPAPREAERFDNCVVTPVVLLRNLDGIMIVADRALGTFEQRDVDSLLSVGSQAAVAVENRHLERQLQSAYVSTVSMLADAVEAKDPYTHGHCEMASRYARLIAERLDLTARERSVVCYSALLHDVGKIGVSDGLLNKPGPLLPEEIALMRAHVRVGHDLLSTIPALRTVAQVVLHHHERYDGTGYPDGLRGTEIPIAARIVGAVDAYCAMVTRRSYKEAYTDEHARRELQTHAGTQFDPGIVSIFLQVLDSPEARDQDEDYDAECGLLPDFIDLPQTPPRLTRGISE